MPSPEFKISLGVVSDVTYAEWSANRPSVLNNRAEQERGAGDHSVELSPERKVVEDLFMQYRVERAVRRMGKIALLILALALVSAFMAIFTPKYL